MLAKNGLVQLFYKIIIIMEVGDCILQQLHLPPMYLPSLSGLPGKAPGHAPYISFYQISRKCQAIDVHTHMYLPAYMKMLRSRSNVPRIKSFGGGKERLIILPGEDVESTTAAGVSHLSLC